MVSHSDSDNDDLEEEINDIKIMGLRFLLVKYIIDDSHIYIL